MRSSGVTSRRRQPDETCGVGRSRPGGAGSGHPGRRRERPHDVGAAGRGRGPGDAGEPPGLPGDAGHHARAGRTFPVALRELGMMAGIRVDAGAKPLAGTRGETVTEGLDGLLPRLREYAELGAEFARWRAVLQIAPGMPSPVAVRANAQALGRYA